MTKKKIKDFTIEEINEICSKQLCTYCPLRTFCDNKFIMSKKDLEKEIEVEEDKPQKCKDLRGCC